MSMYFHNKLALQGMSILHEDSGHHLRTPLSLLSFHTQLRQPPAHIFYSHATCIYELSTMLSSAFSTSRKLSEPDRPRLK